MTSSDERTGFRPIVPAANGAPYEVVESELNWRPILEHECTIGPWFATEQEAIDAAEERLESDE